MKKFKSFIDLNVHIKIEKETRINQAIEKLQSGVFIENFENLTDEQIKRTLIDEHVEYLDYALLNKDKIVFDKVSTERYISWDNLFVIYKLKIEDIEIDFKVRLLFSNEPMADHVSVEADEIFLKDEFIKKYTVKHYNEHDIGIIKTYSRLFEGKKPQSSVAHHIMPKKAKIKIKENIEYQIYYEFYIRKRISAGVSKNLMVLATTQRNKSDFPEKVKKYIETEYTLPILGKTVDDLTDDDITVFNMYQI